MKIHGPSIALGLSTGLLVVWAARRLRPVAVELGALSIELVKMARSLVELQRESVEDFVFEVERRSVDRARVRREERAQCRAVEARRP